MSLPNGTNRRIELTRAKMAEKQLPALLVSQITNVGWLTGFTGSNGFLLLTADRAIFATDSRYTEQAAQQCAGFELRKLETSAPEEIAGVLIDPGARRIGFESNHLTHHLFETYRDKLPADFELVPTDRLVDDLRLVKDSEEISRIGAACSRTDEAFHYILPFLKPGAVERDVALELEWYFRKTCGVENAFEIIVLSGAHGALPHGKPSNKRMEAGDFVTLDFGARIEGYNADLTRTVALGSITDEQRKVYQVVRDAEQMGIDALVPGAEGKVVDALARDFIATQGYGDYFGHGLGHSLGRAVHDGMGLGKRSDITLAPGMVMTVEPGIYIPGWGGVRIEDDVLITDSTPRLLTHSPKDLLIL